MALFIKEATAALARHDNTLHDGYCEIIEYYGDHRVTKTVKACEWCGEHPE